MNKSNVWHPKKQTAVHYKIKKWQPDNPVNEKLNINFKSNVGNETIILKMTEDSVTGV